MSNPRWNHTLLRVKDADAHAEWYGKHFGFEVVQRDEFEDHRITYVATLPAGTPKPDDIRATSHVLLGFRADKADEKNDDFQVNSGNKEPHRGFGHVAVLVDDVYKKCDELIAAGVQFQKKPDEGNMKGLAFALDPHGYWIEIIKRGDNHGLTTPVNLAQTMIRVADADKTLDFYNGKLGMTTVTEKHFPQWKFSLYFLASLSPEDKAGAPSDTKSDAAWEYMKKLHDPILEITHNHDSEERYHNGHDEKPELRGFNRLGFLVDDVSSLPDGLKPIPDADLPKDAGSEPGAVYVSDPQGYIVQLRSRTK